MGFTFKELIGNLFLHHSWLLFDMFLIGQREGITVAGDLPGNM
jgi:hypothetical protein